LPTVAELTHRLRRGDEEGFREFHRLYFDRLFRYHLVLARGDEVQAQEALQETFIRVVKHARRFEEEQTFWCWLTVLARSAARDCGRRRTRYWAMLTRYATSLLGRPVEDSCVADADARLEEIATAALAALPVDERQLLEGKYYRRATVRELAGESGLSEKAVESRLLRARAKVKEYILERLKHES